MFSPAAMALSTGCQDQTATLLANPAYQKAAVENSLTCSHTCPIKCTGSTDAMAKAVKVLINSIQTNDIFVTPATNDTRNEPFDQSTIQP